MFGLPDGCEIESGEGYSLPGNPMPHKIKEYFLLPVHRFGGKRRSQSNKRTLRLFKIQPLTVQHDEGVGGPDRKP